MKTDVLIVGAGPVGLTMAIELARYGVAVRIVEKAATRTGKSKALVIWSRPLELLERAGCSETLVAAGYQVDSLNISANNKTIAHLSLDGLKTKYPYGLMIPQSETERILEEFLTSLGVRVERSVELINFKESNDCVVSTLRQTEGVEETLETAWLIGCDGAHSTVRRLLGKEFCGETSLIDWILADIHLENTPRKPRIDIVWHSDGILAMFPIAENRYRIIADVGVAHDSENHRPEPTLTDVQGVLDKRFPGSVRATDPIWLSAFRISERKVSDYRSGRAFLAGDAAHVHSPAGGQGMNTGMQDACNLAWKLALTVRGTASEQLLESYSAERSPIAEQVLKVTGRATSIGTLSGNFTQSLRNHTVALVLGLPPLQTLAANMVSEISIGYPHSALNASHGYKDPLPGTRAPIRTGETPVGGGGSPRFALFSAGDAMSSDLRQRYGHLLEPALRPPFDSAGLWLVRPDGYVALAAKAGDWVAVTRYFDNGSFRHGSISKTASLGSSS